MEPILNGEKKLNLRYEEGADIPLDITSDEVPTLLPSKHLKEIQKGDKDPYYKIQAIKYPIKANGWNYLESFFKSFIGKLNVRPIPGSKSGHETSWGARPTTDLYLVGAKMESNGDGGGTVYLKNYIPPMGDNDISNDRFIQDNKTNIVEYSLVSYTEDAIIEDEQGNRIYNVVGSRFGERNDAVEYANGAMEQRTNSADAEDINNSGEKSMNKDEVLKTLKTLKTNGQITLKEIAVAMELEDQMVTEAHVNAVDTVKKLNELIPDGDVIATVKTLKATNEESETGAIEAKMNAAFGAVAEDGQPENLRRTLANDLIGAVKANEIDAKIEEVKANSVMIKLAGESADVTSKTNAIDENKDAKKNNGVKEMRY